MHWTVTALLLTAHLLLVDVAMIGPLLAVWCDWRSDRERSPVLAEIGRQLAWISVNGLILGGLLGGLLLALRYAVDERYFRALAAVPRDRLWFAGAEWLFGLVCLLLYAALWRSWRRARVLHRLVALAAATNLLIHFPTFFVVVSVIRSRPALLADVISRGEYRRLLIEPEVLARVLHVWLAAGAVTGLVVVWLVLRRGMLGDGRAEEHAAVQERFIKLGGRLAMAAVMLQFPVGLWVALVMPQRARLSLLGHDAGSTLMFLTSVALAMLLLNLISGLILGEQKRAMARRSTVVLVVLVLLMVGVRLRTGEAGDGSQPRATANPSQDSSCVAENIGFNGTTRHIPAAFTLRVLP